jgi:hypothetical protein
MRCVACWPIAPFMPFRVWQLPVQQTQDTWAAPVPDGGRALSRGERPLDRACKWSQPIRVTIAPPRTSAAYATPASITQTIRTGAVVSPGVDIVCLDMLGAAIDRETRCIEDAVLDAVVDEHPVQPEPVVACLIAAYRPHRSVGASLRLSAR